MELAITDTGVGMDRASLDRIFEPYFSTRASGTGLGLTIAKRNVELNGGTIAVASERGKGTTVTMALPWLCRLDEGASEAQSLKRQGEPIQSVHVSEALSF